MPDQKQEGMTFVNEQETSSNNPPWHAPVLNVYSAEDAEMNFTPTKHNDSSGYWS
jgi:hypothetical protein